MPIVVKHDPSAAAVGLPAYLGGYGQFLQQRDQFQFGVDRFNKELGERQREFDTSQEFNQDRLSLQKREADRAYGFGIQDRMDSRRTENRRTQLAERQMAIEQQERQQMMMLRANAEHERQQTYRRQIEQRQNAKMLEMTDNNRNIKFKQMQSDVGAARKARNTLTPAQYDEVMEEIRQKYEGEFDLPVNIPVSAPDPPQTIMYPMEGYDEPLEVTIGEDGDITNHGMEMIKDRREALNRKREDKEKLDQLAIDDDKERNAELLRVRSDKLKYLHDNVTAARGDYNTLLNSRLSIISLSREKQAEGDSVTTPGVEVNADKARKQTAAELVTKWDEAFRGDFDSAKERLRVAEDLYKTEYEKPLRDPVNPTRDEIQPPQTPYEVGNDSPADDPASRLSDAVGEILENEQSLRDSAPSRLSDAVGKILDVKKLILKPRQVPEMVDRMLRHAHSGRVNMPRIQELDDGSSASDKGDVLDNILERMQAEEKYPELQMDRKQWSKWLLEYPLIENAEQLNDLPKDQEYVIWHPTKNRLVKKKPLLE